MSRSAPVLAALSVAALPCCKSSEVVEPPLVQSDYETQTKPVIARAPNADADGPALALAANGDLYRVGAKTERIAKAARCVGPAGSEAKVVTDEGVIRVGLDAVTPDGPAIAGLVRCSIGADGSVIAIAAGNVVRVEAGGPKVIAPLPKGQTEPVGVAYDRDGRAWVLDAEFIHAFKDGAWKRSHASNVSGSVAQMRRLDLNADGTLAVANEYNSYNIIASGKSRSVYISAGLKSMIPDAVGSGADGTIWAGDYQYVARVNGEDSQTWQRVSIGFHGGEPTAITGDGRGRGWVANEASLSVVSHEGKLIAEVGGDALGGQAITRLVVVGGGPAEIKGGEVSTFKGKVTGYVRVRDEIVPGARVLLCGKGEKADLDPCANAKVVFKTVTDDDGAYTIEGVPPLDMHAVVEVGGHQFVPFSAQCCGLMKKDAPYRLNFDLGDSISEQGKPSCPPKPPAGARAAIAGPPCKIPGIESRKASAPKNEP